MIQELTIRDARPSDVAGVQRVARDAWHAAYDAFLGASVVDSTVEDWYDDRELLEVVSDADSVFLVAERDGDVIGFATAVPQNDEFAGLSRLYVDPVHWNHGIGGALVARTEYRLREDGFDRLKVVVFADNDVGVSFYESNGFERLESRSDEFTGETFEEYVYEKELELAR